jgi:hypothetical protein
MNKIQKEYKKALAAWKSSEMALDRAEMEFIRENQIKNADGLLVKSLIHIENDEVFETMNEKFFGGGRPAVENEVAARKELEKKEKALINYALSIVPAPLADQLKEGSRIVAFRKKIIDIIMEFDGKVPFKVI